MIGYRKMKAAGLWELSRDGDDVGYTRKSFDKETGKEKDSKYERLLLNKHNRKLILFLLE